MTDPRNELKPGQIQWHTSDEEGGTPDVGMLLQIDADNSLWIGEITRRRWEEAGSDAAELGSDIGWWIIHYTKTDSTVLGKCVSSWPELSTDFLDSIAAAIARTADGPEPVAWQVRSAVLGIWGEWREVPEATADHVRVLNRQDEHARPLYAHPVSADGPADAVSEAEVEAALGAWRAAPGLGVNKAIIRICLEAAQRARK